MSWDAHNSQYIEYTGYEEYWGIVDDDDTVLTSSSGHIRKSKKEKLNVRDVIMAEALSDPSADRIASPYYKVKENYRESVKS